MTGRERPRAVIDHNRRVIPWARSDCCSDGGIALSASHAGFGFRSVGKAPEVEAETVSDYNTETVSRLLQIGASFIRLPDLEDPDLD